MASDGEQDHAHTSIGLHTDLDARAAYVFRPHNDQKRSGRPAKRRKVAGSFQETKRHESVMPFVPLLNGMEKEESVRRRHDIFRDFWLKQEKRIQEVYDIVDSQVLRDVSSFIEKVPGEGRTARIPAGLINLGSNLSSMHRLLSHLQHDTQMQKSAKVIVLESGDTPNLKTALKHIIRIGTAGADNEKTTGPKLLSYDLEALYQHMQDQGIQKVVLAFQDSEAFDQTLLADLLSLLSSWIDRISFVLLFGIATTVELFEGRLARSTVNLLEGTRFDIEGCDDLIDRIFTEIQIQPENPVWLGPHASDILLERSRDHFESPESFANGMKYAFMTHFFANPLSTIGLAGAKPEDFQPELCEAIRNSFSFQHHVEALVNGRKTSIARALLQDDHYLASEVTHILNENRAATYQAFRTAQVINDMICMLCPWKKSKTSDFIVQVLSGNLLDSTDVKDLLLAVQKQTSDVAETFLESLPTELSSLDQFSSLTQELKKMTKNRRGKEPLQSEYDDRRQIHTTTVVNQRVRLNKGVGKVSKQDMEYTRFVERLRDCLHDYFAEHLIQRELFLHEAFICDLKMPLKRVLAPRPRFTIERALSSPFDYLIPQSGMSRRALSTAQPATAIIYQLYLESGAAVNVHDLWRAAYTVIGGVDGEKCEERQAMALFYRALSELKLLGMVKNSKRKVDHLAKVTWMGL